MSHAGSSTATTGAGAESNRTDRDDLSRRAARREQRAFADIFKRHHQAIYRYCLSILRHREDAEDALQATMAAALRALPGEQRDIALRPWLFRVAHNESISLVRGRRPTAGPEMEAPIPAASAEAQLADRDRLRQLVIDLQSLPERQRSALVMRELSGLSYGEIGVALSSSEAAARQSVYEGRISLQGLQEGREMGCETVRHAISDRDGRRLRARCLRAHLDSCDGCRGFAASIERRRSDLGALCPALPALAAGGILSGLLGGTGHAAGAGAAMAASGGGLATVGGGLAGTAAVKGAALVAAVAVAAGAADVGGVIDLRHPLDGDASKSATQPAGGEGAPALDLGGGATPSGAPSENESPSPTAGSASGSDGSASDSGSAGGRADPNRGAGGAAAGPTGSVVGHAGSSPGHSGTSPGHLDTAPGHSASAAPGHSGSAPGRSGSAPGHSGSKPGHSGAPPGQSGGGLGQSGSTPGQSAALGHSGGSPGHSAPAGSAAATGGAGSASEVETSSGSSAAHGGSAATAAGPSAAGSGSPDSRPKTPKGSDGTKRHHP